MLIRYKEYFWILCLFSFYDHRYLILLLSSYQCLYSCLPIHISTLFNKCIFDLPFSNLDWSRSFSWIFYDNYYNSFPYHYHFATSMKKWTRVPIPQNSQKNTNDKHSRVKKSLDQLYIIWVLPNLTLFNLCSVINSSSYRR